MALVAHGALSLDDVERLWSPSEVLAPVAHRRGRRRGRDELGRHRHARRETIPELSAVEF